MAQAPRRRGEPLPLPPKPPEGGPDDLDYVYKSPEEQRRIQPYFSHPMMTPETRRYRVGGRQMMDPRESETPQFLEDMKNRPRRLKKGGPVKKKYAEGGEVSPRSGMKSQLQQSRSRTQTLMENPDSLVPRDTSTNRPRQRSMFSVDRESDPIRQRERERMRREQDFNARTNRAIEQEYATQRNLESELEKDQGQSRPKNYKKGGKVGDKKWIQGAVKKPGALRAQMGVKAGEKIPAKKLAAAAKAPGKLGQRARLAQTLGKMKGK